jgi:hypothetical protein
MGKTKCISLILQRHGLRSWGENKCGKVLKSVPVYFMTSKLKLLKASTTKAS